MICHGPGQSPVMSSGLQKDHRLRWGTPQLGSRTWSRAAASPPSRTIASIGIEHCRALRDSTHHNACPVLPSPLWLGQGRFRAGVANGSSGTTSDRSMRAVLRHLCVDDRWGTHHAMTSIMRKTRRLVVIPVLLSGELGSRLLTVTVLSYNTCAYKNSDFGAPIPCPT